MSNHRVTLDFNTAITRINPNTGKWDSDAHDKAIMPLRALIMQTDGVSGCHIARFDVSVTFLPSVTDDDTVIQAVQNAVNEVSSQTELFPLRGKKTPTATPGEPESRWLTVDVKFDTDLYIGTDQQLTKSIVNELKVRLGKADGARKTFVSQRQLQISFNERQVSREVMSAHLQKVVESIMNDRQEVGYFQQSFFPFAEPNFTYALINRA